LHACRRYRYVVDLPSPESTYEVELAGSWARYCGVHLVPEHCSTRMMSSLVDVSVHLRVTVVAVGVAVRPEGAVGTVPGGVAGVVADAVLLGADVSGPRSARTRYP